MASSYSTSLKIQLMANGEDSNTWGTITNTNWNLIEQAVSGVQPITMSNANYTLSNLNGVSDEARNMVLVVGGTSSVSTTPYNQIVAPLVTKFYVITNNTVGGNPITIGGSSGSLITIPNATTVQVYCDGTNFYSAQTASAGNFNVNGNETVSGNLSVAGTLTVAGLPAGFSPTGSVTMYAANSAPTGWLLCNGVAVSRTTYAALFAVVGTTFGAGDGSTTFNLPNYADRMPIGVGSIAASIGATGGSASTTLSVANLPSHSHSASSTSSSSSSVSDPGHSHVLVTHDGSGTNTSNVSASYSNGNPYSTNTNSAYTNISVSTTTTTNTTIGNTGSGTAATTISPYLGINFIIKT
jgi:microcystin-dependent protein